MKLFISVDMEGISGVVAANHVVPTRPGYERFRRLMTAEVNVAIEGALAGGADQIIVADSHFGSTNILIEELNPVAELVCGNPRPFSMMQGISADVDAVFVIGSHAASGTGAAIIEHTWNLHVVQLSLNGQVMGETGINAAVAGAYGAPVLLVTGDKAVTKEARALLGEIETVTVKEAVTQTAAKCLHPKVVQKRIREAAERALKLSVPPYVLSSPITVQIVFQRAGQAAMAEMMPGTRLVDGRTVEWTGEDMPTVYKATKAMLNLSVQGNLE